MKTQEFCHFLHIDPPRRSINLEGRNETNIVELDIIEILKGMNGSNSHRRSPHGSTYFGCYHHLQSVHRHPAASLSTELAWSSD